MNKKNDGNPRLKSLHALFAGLIVLLISDSVFAQCAPYSRTVTRSACPSGYTFGDGTCQSEPNWLGHRSHCRLSDCAVCSGDETLDSGKGLCVRTVTDTRGRAACPSGTVFDGGSCAGAPNWLGHRSHCRISDCHVCTSEETLHPESGTCCPR